MVLKKFLSAIFLTLLGTSANALTVNFDWSGYVFEGSGYIYDSDGDGFLSSSDKTEFSAFERSMAVLYELEDGTIICMVLTLDTLDVNLGAPISVSSLTKGQALDISGRLKIYEQDEGAGGEPNVVYWDFATTGLVGDSLAVDTVPLPATGLMLGSLLLGLPLARRARRS